MKKDHSLDSLLELHGVSYAIQGPFWVKFEVRRVPVTPERPHGLNYALTLHNGNGERILGFDNAHPIREGAGPGAKTRVEYDHKHKGERVRFYGYKDAGTSVIDFWAEVDKILEERSV